MKKMFSPDTAEVVSPSASTAKAQNSPTSFTAMLVHHPVEDFQKWLPVYQAHRPVRESYGLSELSVGRDLDNSNMIYLAFKAENVDRARQFAALPDLKSTMEKAGVTAAPTISYLSVIRDDESPIDQKDRVLVIHHVKDFDAWLKVYDGEGKATRASHGLIDRGLARGIDDPNLVYILFAVSDVAKAKARASSPDLKNLMIDAGVDSAPTVAFYRLIS